MTLYPSCLLTPSGHCSFALGPGLRGNPWNKGRLWTDETGQSQPLDKCPINTMDIIARKDQSFEPFNKMSLLFLNEVTLLRLFFK